jgi:hypothetical protein
MDYNVTDFPKEEFLRLWDIVLLARTGTLSPPYPIPLHRVSDRLEDFAETDRPAITNGEYVGMYYHDGQIWLKPGESFREMQDTVLHELSHHEVAYEAHGPRWREVYGTALALYLRESGYKWQEIYYVVWQNVIAPYRGFRKFTDPEQQRQIIRGEVTRIIRQAKNKIAAHTESRQR